MLSDDHGIKWPRNIAENFNRLSLSRVHKRYKKTTWVHVRYVVVRPSVCLSSVAKNKTKVLKSFGVDIFCSAEAFSSGRNWKIIDPVAAPPQTHPRFTFGPQCAALLSLTLPWLCSGNDPLRNISILARLLLVADHTEHRWTLFPVRS